MRDLHADQHWSMLVFESLSAGVLAVAIAIVAVMALVGAYTILVWPLTLWDLSSLGLDKYEGSINTAVWSVFAGGSLAGFWGFSGAAFKDKKQRTVGSPAASSAGTVKKSVAVRSASASLR
ncbi:MAG TPA: hypothetical protein VI386_02730 [Candidatus Sulfotelmatobacter sp.]